MSKCLANIQRLFVVLYNVVSTLIGIDFHVAEIMESNVSII